MIAERLAALALLLATGGGVGLLVRARLLRCGSARSEGAAERWAPGAAITLLVGLFVLAAALPNLFFVGVPRSVALGLAYAAAGAGAVCAFVDRNVPGRALRLPPRRTAWLCLAIALLLAVPFAYALTRPLLANDAVLVWWPKVREVAAGAWPDLATVTPEHQTPFYPRGLAWLASVAMPWREPDQQIVRLVPLAFTALLALAMAAGGRMLAATPQGVRAAALAAVLFVALPDVAQFCHSGMSDLPIAAAVLCAGIGLARRREHPGGVVLAVAAALGAASIKEEGGIVMLVVVASLGWDFARCPHLRRRALVGAAAFAALLPFVRLRAAVPQTRLDTLGLLLGEPDMLVRRAAAVLEYLGAALAAPSALALDHEPPYAGAVSWAAWAVLLAALALVPARWPRRVAVAPAIVLVAAALAVQVVSSVDVRWHMRTTLPRLAIEVAPLLLLAAAVRLADARAAAQATNAAGS